MILWTLQWDAQWDAQWDRWTSCLTVANCKRENESFIYKKFCPQEILSNVWTSLWTSHCEVAPDCVICYHPVNGSVNYNSNVWIRLIQLEELFNFLNFSNLSLCVRWWRVFSLWSVWSQPRQATTHDRRILILFRTTRLPNAPGAIRFLFS